MISLQIWGVGKKGKSLPILRMSKSLVLTTMLILSCISFSSIAEGSEPENSIRINEIMTEEFL